MYPTVSAPFGLPGNMRRDVRQKSAGRKGQGLSGTGKRGKRLPTSYRNMAGPLIQQQMAAQGLYKPYAGSYAGYKPMAPGYNPASFLTKLAYQTGGMW